MDRSLLRILRHAILKEPLPFRNSRAMTSSQVAETYQDAINRLNNLQSNAQVRASIIANGAQTSSQLKAIYEVKRTLDKMGIPLKNLDERLNIIHVAGTKGKGTTCAFTESILRHAGLRTGLFTSPHLITVRERIKINGKPISEDLFAKYFFLAYNKLQSNKDPDFPMPAYFRFLTCMAFYVFLEERVDVVVLEVGIGGAHDSTNVISNPVAVGITSLGYEHQAILGQTLEEITLNKAGIMKENCPAFTVHNHPPHILNLLKERALQVKCPLSITPLFDEYPAKITLGVDDGSVAHLNASLAIQLSNSFLKQKFPHKLAWTENNCNELSRLVLPFHLRGLKLTNWPGRFQTLKLLNNLRYFLDGAHTTDSLRAALAWFQKRTYESSYRILIFNTTGERTADELLVPVAQKQIFDLAIFTPNLRLITYDSSNDNWSALSAGSNTLERNQDHQDVWAKFSKNAPGVVVRNVDEAIALTRQLSKTLVSSELNPLSAENVNLLTLEKAGKSVEVLVTGSLHLIGVMLSAINPECSENTLNGTSTFEPEK